MEKIKCPECGKRIFDLDWVGRTEIEIKCRHCNKIVAIKRPSSVAVRDDPRQKKLFRE